MLPALAHLEARVEGSSRSSEGDKSLKQNLKGCSEVLKFKVFKVLVKVISKQISKMVFKGFEVQSFLSFSEGDISKHLKGVFEGTCLSVNRNLLHKFQLFVP